MAISTNLARLPSLRYFMEVAHHGSFRRAAEQLNIAPSAINRQISNLEATLGVQLFDRERGRNGLRLTEAGKILQYRVASVMNELVIAGDELNELKGLQRGHLRLGVNEVVAGDLLHGMIANFHSNFPQLTYSVMVENTPEIIRRLQDGDVDIGLGYNFPPTGELEVLATLKRETCLITSLDHRLARRRVVRLDEITGENFIFPDRSVALRRMLDDTFTKAGLKVHPIMETNSFTLLRQMVQNGLGVSMVVGQFLQHHPEKIAFVRVDNPAIDGGMLSCCRIAGRTLSTASHAFSASVKALFSQYGG
ncbi:Cyn operon transcriptional activator [Hartmannibacter diazotrophicus]|uniref:Cyn operon transcriptional activator n=1 Tax=Hartmannibacter diazotrophicus TaxID=1482074 RepID=A0A2C9D8Z1_9HYPH|nr:LysR family transcriptional regulator [Hartmannibacter diazotrophicus]SON56649.1 Cyn operon transcriptional activator [Hartmannibacter diazotrophicus]